MASQRDSAGKDSATSKRLRLLRKAEGDDSSSAWAERMGLTQPQLSNYENGIPLSRDAAIKMAEHVPGLTTD
jgi:transcriptional regulator with XRE-family HTH domain